jgi:SIT4-associating protein SAP185/190
VYDIVQQVFNGPMSQGFNRTLAVSLFEAADITNAIINGQLASEQSQRETKTRMGYMGHLTLIAEEVVKFTERHPPELLSDVVLDRVMSPDWSNYVEGALAETRERDNAILGGVRPEVAMSNRAAMSGMALSSLGLSQGGPSNALAEAGLNGGGNMEIPDSGSSSSLGPFSISSGLHSGFGSSSDEEEEEPEETEEDVNNEVSELSYSLQRVSGHSPSDVSSSSPSKPRNISRATAASAALIAVLSGPANPVYNLPLEPTAPQEPVNPPATEDNDWSDDEDMD